MNISLQNKVAVVTGAGRGIGLSIALALAEAGADVACVSRSEKNALHAAEEVAAKGRKAKAYALDVSEASAVDQAADQILKDFGRIDILVNNAGINKDGLIMRMPEADWDVVLDVNLKGAFLWTKVLSRHLLKQRSGKVLNITSVIGLIGNAGQANYAASKAGLIGFTRSIAREFASRGIQCNASAPGFIETDMTDALTEEQKSAILKQVPLARFGQPEDVAQLALFLVSGQAEYITGQVFNVDGGMVIG